MLGVGAMYADSYTLAGCSNPNDCGVFKRVLAHCASGDHCPAGQYANGNTDPTLCDGAPVYQKSSDDVEGGGRVLFRKYDPSSHITQWWVAPAGSYVLAYCDLHGYYLSSRTNPGLGSAPTAPVYSIGGWRDFDVTPNQYDPISVTPTGGTRGDVG
eukprot:COSAG02_NODE_6641_length_3441_cov_5.384201_3_plen_156_part_00